MGKTMSLEAFQSLLSSNEEFKQEVTGRCDLLDFDNGTAIIHAENINKYLETYLCKDTEDLTDTLWFNYGVFVHIVE